MAINPMQRRTRNSFLIGLLIGVVLLVAVVVLFVSKINNLNKTINTMQSKIKTVYVAGSYLESGAIVSIEDFKREAVQTTVDTSEIVSDEDFNSAYEDKEGRAIAINKKMKVGVPAGTIVTKDMLEDEDINFSDDIRIEEFNMILLPTTLVNGNYIDIRFRLPEGEDYVVVSKKMVEKCTADTIWIELTEDEILTLGNAIVEAYMINGSKLYATVYAEAGRQDAASVTYPVNDSVASLIRNSPNVIDTAKRALVEKLNGDAEERNKHIYPKISGDSEQNNEAVEAGIQEEITKMQEGRAAYVEGLVGTGLVGLDQ